MFNQNENGPLEIFKVRGWARFAGCGPESCVASCVASCGLGCSEVAVAKCLGGCSEVAVQLAVCQRPVAVKTAVGWVAVSKWT